MNHPAWEEIAGDLRTEIAGYGGLLNALAAQQRSVLGRDVPAIVRLTGEIEALLEELQGHRRRREAAVADFARRHDLPAAATLRSLLPLFEEAARPLLEALMAEVNVLIHRTRRLNRHNHALLAHAAATHREIMQSLRPDAFIQTYTAGGRVAPGGPGTRVLQQTG